MTTTPSLQPTKILVPRYYADIETRKRTVLHILPLENDPLVPGAQIHLLAGSRAVRCMVGTVVQSTLVQLMSTLEEDLSKVGSITRDEYLESWNLTNPEHPWQSDPLIRRIEFKYGWGA